MNDFSPFDLPLTDPRHPFHVEHMEMALDEARTAQDEDEVPIGCVIVSTERGVIGRAHNLRETLKDPTAHAEMIAITQAAPDVGPLPLVKIVFPLFGVVFIVAALFFGSYLKRRAKQYQAAFSRYRQRRDQLTGGTP